MLADHGYDLQDKSKQSLNRTLNKVHETQALANDAVTNLKKQSEQILRINDTYSNMATTM